MRRECRERFPRHRLQRKPLVSDPGMHQGTCVTHVPWCMSGSLTHGGGENVPSIPGACATRNFTYLTRGPCQGKSDNAQLGLLTNSHILQRLTNMAICKKNGSVVGGLWLFQLGHIIYRYSTQEMAQSYFLTGIWIMIRTLMHLKRGRLIIWLILN